MRIMKTNRPILRHHLVSIDFEKHACYHLMCWYYHNNVVRVFKRYGRSEQSSIDDILRKSGIQSMHHFLSSQNSRWLWLSHCEFPWLSPLIRRFFSCIQTTITCRANTHTLLWGWDYAERRVVGAERKPLAKCLNFIPHFTECIMSSRF